MTEQATEALSASELLRAMGANKQETSSEPKQRAARGRPAQAITKASLRGAFEFAGLALMVTGIPPLTTEEVSSLTDSWYEVLKMYPTAAKYLVAGNKLTAWGNAVFCTAMVVMRRVPNAPNNQAGPTRTPMWHDWLRQNHSGETDTEQQEIRASN